jgi:hypothetical protein
MRFNGVLQVSRVCMIEAAVYRLAPVPTHRLEQKGIFINPHSTHVCSLMKIALL